MKCIKISEILPIDEKSSSASSWFLQQTTFNSAELKLRQGEEPPLCKCESEKVKVWESEIVNVWKSKTFNPAELKLRQGEEPPMSKCECEKVKVWKSERVDMSTQQNSNLDMVGKHLYVNVKVKKWKCERVK